MEIVASIALTVGTLFLHENGLMTFSAVGQGYESSEYAYLLNSSDEVDKALQTLKKIKETSRGLRGANDEI